MPARLDPIRVDHMLATAVHRGDVRAVHEMLAHGAVASAANEFGMTPLHVAAEMGHFDVALALCERGASTRAANASGETALHIAAREGDAALAELLLRHGASATQADRWGRTPADLADDVDDAAERFDVLQLLSRAAGPAGGRELRASERAQGLVMGVRVAQITHATAVAAAPRAPAADDGGGAVAAPLARALGPRPAAKGVDGLVVHAAAVSASRGTVVAIGTDSDDGSFHSIVELTPSGTVLKQRGGARGSARGGGGGGDDGAGASEAEGAGTARADAAPPPATPPLPLVSTGAGGRRASAAGTLAGGARAQGASAARAEAAPGEGGCSCQSPVAP
ncbi:hypothetical protein KFE25_005643 [Diacronema lutheri]|uniref:RING-type E3 ubiquitin transferase n=1 Tax=Diacronema lutheri TaxID=2081491 RepID=A0A8J6CFW2_DIALT|nr:hypothetical protein KFE25_005643 [Diacronema lutheri]